jgi:DNA-binding CsgD family transcriptional regulator
VPATLHHPESPTATVHDGDSNAAAALAPMVEVWFRILTEHVPDPDYRCRACTGAGTGALSTPWPCSLRSLADRARRRHAAGRPEPTTRGRRSLHGAQGTSCPVTPREREFLQMAVEGRGDEEIAALLDVPERTVRTTIRRIARKLGEPDRTGLLVLALRSGVIV